MHVDVVSPYNIYFDYTWSKVETDLDFVFF